MSKLCAGHKGGFILARVLISVLIALCITPLCMACIAPLRGIMEFHDEIQDEISAMQLRRLLLVSDKIQIEGNVLSFTYQQRHMELAQSAHHVILHPGTQIYFTETDSCRFSDTDGVLMIVYERNNREYRKVLAKVP